MFGVHIIPPSQEVQFTKCKPPEWLLIPFLVSGSPGKSKKIPFLTGNHPIIISWTERLFNRDVVFKPVKDHRQVVCTVPSGE
jgi:hypothetical protein